MKIIIGLPGSGKDFLAERIKEDSSVIVKDPLTLDSLFNKSEEELENVILIDTSLCLESIRYDFFAKLYFKNILFEVFYFENNYLQCKINSFGDENKIKDIKIISPQYSIPLTHKPLKVYVS